ncbi:hypothetical protein PVAP13_2KG237400 [Panicum virgatum]|uniref:Uncharacterized protein n=1 Tax=Panicum virgatum TaxID=38727 RepID=A0A8T0VZW5_PANVG|nr:hypothetical protein PVAP13_2KG237400 [Panicum virgatum]
MVELADALATLASSSSLAVHGAFGVFAVSSPAPAMTAFDSLGGVLGDVSCGVSKAWSPLPGGEVDLDRCGGGDGELETRDEEDDAVVVTANWRPDMRKMTMCPEDSFVIFLFFGGPVCKRGVYYADVYL